MLNTRSSPLNCPQEYPELYPTLVDTFISSFDMPPGSDPQAAIVSTKNIKTAPSNFQLPIKPPLLTTRWPILALKAATRETGTRHKIRPIL